MPMPTIRGSSLVDEHHTSTLSLGPWWRRRSTSPVVELTYTEEDDGVDEAEFFVDQNSHDLQCRGHERRRAGIDGDSSQLTIDQNGVGSGNLTGKSCTGRLGQAAATLFRVTARFGMATL